MSVNNGMNVKLCCDQMGHATLLVVGTPAGLGLPFYHSLKFHTPENENQLGGHVDYSPP